MEKTEQIDQTPTGVDLEGMLLIFEYLYEKFSSLSFTSKELDLALVSMKYLADGITHISKDLKIDNDKKGSESGEKQ